MWTVDAEKMLFWFNPNSISKSIESSEKTQKRLKDYIAFTEDMVNIIKYEYDSTKTPDTGCTLEKVQNNLLDAQKYQEEINNKLNKLRHGLKIANKGAIFVLLYEFRYSLIGVMVYFTSRFLYQSVLSK